MLVVLHQAQLITMLIYNYITIASEGNAIDFGDLTQNSSGGGTLASSTRGVFRIGGQGGSYVNSIEYVEIMTLGNSLDFGDLYKVWSGSGGACSSPTRGLFVGGYTSPSLIEIDRYSKYYYCIKREWCEIWRFNKC